MDISGNNLYVWINRRNDDSLFLSISGLAVKMETNQLQFSFRGRIFNIFNNAGSDPYLINSTGMLAVLILYYIIYHIKFKKMGISVCLATYNGEKYIKQQLSSILSQFSPNDEIIISDDGSNDNTLRIIRGFKDQRIKIFNNKGPHGVVPNFENAIKHASGDFIFLSDQDDIWLLNKKEKCLSCLQEYDFISHNAFIVDEYGVLSGKDYFSLRGTRYGYWTNLWKMGYLGCCMAFRRKCLKDILPFPQDLLWHDMWIASVLHLKYKGRLLDDGLILYRRHGDNASPTTQKSQYSWRFKFQYRNYIFWQSLKRVF